MIRRLTVTAVLATAAIAGAAPAAQASYTPVQPLPGDTTVVGDKIPVTGGGFAPGAPVTLTLVDANGKPVATVVVNADAQGKVAYTFDTPAGGVYQITMSGKRADGATVSSGSVVDLQKPGATEQSSGSRLPVMAPVVDAGIATEVSPNASGGPVLAHTGADGLGMQVWAGAGLLGVGAALVGLTVVRRRHAREA